MTLQDHNHASSLLRRQQQQQQQQQQDAGDDDCWVSSNDAIRNIELLLQQSQSSSNLALPATAALENSLQKRSNHKTKRNNNNKSKKRKTGRQLDEPFSMATATPTPFDFPTTSLFQAATEALGGEAFPDLSWGSSSSDEESIGGPKNNNKLAPIFPSLAGPCRKRSLQDMLWMHKAEQHGSEGSAGCSSSSSSHSSSLRSHLQKRQASPPTPSSPVSIVAAASAALHVLQEEKQPEQGSKSLVLSPSPFSPSALPRSGGEEQKRQGQSQELDEDEAAEQGDYFPQDTSLPNYNAYRLARSRAQLGLSDMGDASKESATALRIPPQLASTGSFVLEIPVVWVQDDENQNHASFYKNTAVASWSMVSGGGSLSPLSLSPCSSRDCLATTTEVAVDDDDDTIFSVSSSSTRIQHRKKIHKEQGGKETEKKDVVQKEALPSLPLPPFHKISEQDEEPFRQRPLPGLRRGTPNKDLVAFPLFHNMSMPPPTLSLPTPSTRPTSLTHLYQLGQSLIMTPDEETSASLSSSPILSNRQHLRPRDDLFASLLSSQQRQQAPSSSVIQRATAALDASLSQEKQGSPFSPSRVNPLPSLSLSRRTPPVTGMTHFGSHSRHWGDLALPEGCPLPPPPPFPRSASTTLISTTSRMLSPPPDTSDEMVAIKGCSEPPQLGEEEG